MSKLIYSQWQRYIERVKKQIGRYPKAAATAFNSLVSTYSEDKGAVYKAMLCLGDDLSTAQVQKLFKHVSVDSKIWLCAHSAFYLHLSTGFLLDAANEAALMQVVALTLACKLSPEPIDKQHIYQAIAALKPEDASPTVATQLKLFSNIPLEALLQFAQLSPRHAKLVIENTLLARDIFDLWQQIAEHYDQELPGDREVRAWISNRWCQRLQTVKHTADELAMSERALQALQDKRLSEFNDVHKEKYVNPLDIEIKHRYSLKWMAPIVRGASGLLGTSMGATAMGVMGLPVFGPPSLLFSSLCLVTAEKLATYLEDHEFTTQVRPQKKA